MVAPTEAKETAKEVVEVADAAEVVVEAKVVMAAALEAAKEVVAVDVAEVDVVAEGVVAAAAALEAALGEAAASTYTFFKVNFKTHPYIKVLRPNAHHTNAQMHWTK